MNRYGPLTVADEVADEWVDKLRQVHTDLHLTRKGKETITMWAPSNMTGRRSQVMIWLPNRMDVEELEFFVTMATLALKKQLPAYASIDDAGPSIYVSMNIDWLTLPQYIATLKRTGKLTKTTDAVVFYVCGLAK